MYEEKKRSIKIDWKSLLIKLGILLVVVFIIVWIVSLFNRKDEVPSNFGTNLKLMRDATTEYFTGSRLPKEIDDSTKITLQEMFDRNLLVEFTDAYGNSCDTQNSYAEATRLDEENYRIEIRLVCGEENDTIINTIQYQSKDDEEVNDEFTDNEETNDDSDDSQVDQKPSDPVVDLDKNDQNKPSNSGQTTGNSSGSNNSSSNNSSTNNKPKPVVCTYGFKNYATVYPLAYVVSGDCAVSYSSISGTYANRATEIGLKEYRKLQDEMNDLEDKKGVQLVVSTPEYAKIKNKAGTGYVGYQIYFDVKQKISTYALKTIYSYYLDQNGNRTVIVDSRNSLYSSDNNDSSFIAVSKVQIKQGNINLDVGDTYYLSASVYPSNATNKSVSWSSSNTSVVSVSSNGKVTAKREGVATITAKAGNKSDTIKVYVEDNEINVTSVVINKTSLTLDVGDTYYLSASVYPSNATNKNVSWSSSNTSVVSVSSNGKVTAKREGVATITAKAGNKSDSILVYVHDDQVDVSQIIINHSNLSLEIGEYYQLSALVYPVTATNLKISWSSSNANVVSVSSNGLVHAKNEGEAVITAKIGNRIDTIKVNVFKEAIDAVGIVLYPQTLTLDVGEVYTISAYVYPIDATNKNLVFSSSDVAIASITGDGTIIARKKGKVTITARIGNISATMEVVIQ